MSLLWGEIVKKKYTTPPSACPENEYPYPNELEKPMGFVWKTHPNELETNELEKPMGFSKFSKGENNWLLNA